MKSITARIPLIDWRHGFARHWNGNPGVTHAFNALSLLFPQAERFFIDVAREVAGSIDMKKNPPLECAVKGFIAQESTHSHQHIEYNQVLNDQGFENISHNFILELQEKARRNFSPLTRLAIVAAYEHHTAVLGNYILSHPQALQSAQPDMALVWGWHSAEETEHKSVCFDLYRAAGGGWLLRISMFFLATTNFTLMFGLNYWSLLWRDGCLKPSRIIKTVSQSMRFFFGISGVGWYFLRDSFRYLSPAFHPWDEDNKMKMQAWFAVNQSRLCKIR